MAKTCCAEKENKIRSDVNYTKVWMEKLFLFPLYGPLGKDPATISDEFLEKCQRGGHSGLNQGVRPSYYNFQIPPRTLCTISTDCFAESPVTVSFDHILCTFCSINMRRFTHQMTNQ